MADELRSPQQNAALNAIASVLKGAHEFGSRPFGYENPPVRLLSELLGIPATARTVERMSYGEPLTTGRGMTTRLRPDTEEALMAVAPFVGPTGRAALSTGRALAPTAGALAMEAASRTGMPVYGLGVVKPKGGNWLAGSVERAIEPMRSTTIAGETPAQRIPRHEALLLDPTLNADQLDRVRHQLGVTQQDASVDKWLGQKLAKYIEKEMATPEDPVRALAERGVLHFDPAMSGYGLKKPRTAGGFPEEGLGVSDLARRWESRADSELSNVLQASDITKGYPGKIDENPWLLKVPPETRVYDIFRGSDRDLGFDHLVDELRNAINPESGLPAALRWKYQDLEKVTVPQAVERVAKINEWRAANKAEADMARAMGPATHVIKEYPDQGFKWVELKAPKETGRKIGVEKPEMDLPPDFNERMGREVAEDMAFDEGLEEGTREFNDFVRRTMDDFNRKKTVEMDESVKALEDALKYEGETMGHCVGGYCPDVVEGRSRIYSLRDKKGQPHVTIEVAPRPLKTWDDVTAAVGPDEARKLHKEFDEIGGYNMDNTDAAFDMFIQNKGIKPAEDIVQIKGKSNRAPKEEYLPAVQDFIRSGNWGKIGDAQNAGLRKFTDVFGSGELRMLQEAGAELPNSGWLTGEDIQRLHNMITPEGKRLKYDSMGRIVGGDEASGFAMGGLVQKYADGGLVGSNIYNSDAMQDPASAYRFADGGQAGDVRAYAEGGVVDKYEGGGIAPHGLRHSGEGVKGSGYFGRIPTRDGYMTELSAEDDTGEYPLLVPGLTGAEIRHLVEGNEPTDEIHRKASKHAASRRSAGRSPFMESTGLRTPMPDGYASGGVVSGANSPTVDFDQARIDAIVGDLNALNAG